MTGELFLESRLWLPLLTQGTACLVAGLVGSYVLAHHAARAHRVLWIATLAAVVMPTAYLLANHLQLGILTSHNPAAVSARDGALPVLSDIDPGPLADKDPVSRGADIAMPTVVRDVGSIIVPWHTIGLACWLTLAGLLLARLLLRFLLGRRLIGQSRTVERRDIREALDRARHKIGIDAAVVLRQSPKVRSPIIWCWRHPPVLVMHDYAKHGTRTVDWVGVFCHELAHWKRLDHLTGLLLEVVAAVVPWHPLIWWARHRLQGLSETVCDDWVLASGRVGVDYAESLLNLSPERRPAFLPTVAGKDKAMKKRIHRIVEGRTSNPRIGLRWTLAVVALTALVTVGAALAQRRPAEGRQREEQVQLRRVALQRELEQLLEHVREMEAALEEPGDERDPERAALEARLDLKRELVGMIERQVRNTERIERPREERNVDAATRMEALARKQDELAEKARDMERKLDSMGDRRPEARRELQRELASVQENIERLQLERAEIQRQRAGRRDTEVQGRLQVLDREQDELNERARDVVRELEALGDRRPEVRRDLQRQLREIHENVQRLEQEKTETARSQPRERAERSRQPNPEIRELTTQLSELRERARELRGELSNIENQDSERAQELRKAQQEVHQRIRTAEANLNEIRSRGTRDRIPRPRREDGLARAHEGLMAQMRQTEEELYRAREREDPSAEQLQRVFEQLNERRQALELKMEQMNGQEPQREGIEAEVEQLRRKVDGMHEQMEQMRQMLRELLERRETIEREVEIEIQR